MVNNCFGLSSLQYDVRRESNRIRVTINQIVTSFFSMSWTAIGWVFSIDLSWVPTMFLVVSVCYCVIFSFFLDFWESLYLYCFLVSSWVNRFFLSHSYPQLAIYTCSSNSLASTFTTHLIPLVLPVLPALTHSSVCHTVCLPVILFVDFLHAPQTWVFSDLFVSQSALSFLWLNFLLCAYLSLYSVCILSLGPYTPNSDQITKSALWRAS